MVKMRLMRMGRKKLPFYRVVAVDSRKKRDGQYIEQLGWYNPVAKTEETKLSLNEEVCKKWIAVGAQPSDTVKSLFRKAGILESVKK